MAMFGKVRRMYYPEHLAISEIVRLTSLLRNTAKKWLRAPAGSEQHYLWDVMPCKLAPFEVQLRDALEADARRPRRERCTARRLLQELREAGFTGGYTILTDYVRAWRVTADQARAQNAFLPLKFMASEAFQFDWSEESLVICGLHRKLQVAQLLRASCAHVRTASIPGQI